MRIPEPRPLGLTVFLPIILAIVRASFLNSSLGGNVETVFTFRTHFLLAAIAPSQAIPHKRHYDASVWLWTSLHSFQLNRQEPVEKGPVPLQCQAQILR